jgi:hypothetical protein
MTFTKGQIRSIRKQRWSLAQKFRAHDDDSLRELEIVRFQEWFYISSKEFCEIMQKSKMMVIPQWCLRSHHQNKECESCKRLSQKQDSMFCYL